MTPEDRAAMQHSAYKLETTATLERKLRLHLADTDLRDAIKLLQPAVSSSETKEQRR